MGKTLLKFALKWASVGYIQIARSFGESEFFPQIFPTPNLSGSHS